MTPPAIEAGAPDPTSADPMLQVVRQRHPDVDFVVLPQQVPAPTAPLIDASQRDALAAELEQSLGDLLARLRPPDGSLRREGRWHTDELHQTWFESVAVVRGLAEGENVALLRSTGNVLVGLGWQARPVPGDRPRLVARRHGGFDATATVRPTSLVLTLRTSKVRVAEEVTR